MNLADGRFDNNVLKVIACHMFILLNCHFLCFLSEVPSCDKTGSPIILRSLLSSLLLMQIEPLIVPTGTSGIPLNKSSTHGRCLILWIIHCQF